MKKLIALLMAVLTCVALCACVEDTDSSEPAVSAAESVGSVSGTTDSKAEESTESSAEPGISLSDDLADFTVSIEGVVYQLPCGVEQLLNNGWTHEKASTFEIAAEKTGMLELWNGSDKSVSITVYNPGPDTKTYNECMILEITESIWASDSQDAEVLIAGGFDVNNNMTTEAVTAAFGADENEHYHNSDSYGLYYEYDLGHYLFADLDEAAAKWSIKLNKSVIRELAE